MTASLVCAVDVGTASARAGIFELSGRCLGRARHPIALNRPSADRAEHNSEDIWRAVCAAVKSARREAGASTGAIAGIAFDATCSLVLRDQEGRPLGVSDSGDDGWDMISWLDHRAIAEADDCTATRHPVLAFSGGVMSPEMQVPKLMWLKRHLPERWRRVGGLYDLADFLSFRASGSRARSQCTLACKWAYLPRQNDPWPHDFFARVGLEDMLGKGGLPDAATPVGTDLGPLTAQSAADLGLGTQCRVAAGVIDAYAGALGSLGGLAAEPGALDRTLALVAGTSSCVMAMSEERLAFPGGWGPYPGAALPGFWIAEGGQSATGALLDHVVRLHGAGGEPTPARHAEIAERISELRQQDGYDLAGRLHVLPDFHGNRSPLADPHALGVVSGLTLDASFDGLCKLYWRTAVGIVLGVRQIVETLKESGRTVETLHVTGGHTRSPLLMDLYASAVGCTIAEPVPDDAVLLGTAALAATGAGLHPSVLAACTAMGQPARVRSSDPQARKRLDRDYRIFLEMQRHREQLDAL